MAKFANAIRGEAACRIGQIDFVMSITFSGLTRLSEALGARSLDDIYARLLGFEPKAVACGIRCFIVADDEDKAEALSAMVMGDDNISGADEVAWRDAIEKALLSYVEAGRRHRDERSASEVVSDALGGNVARPS